LPKQRQRLVVAPGPKRFRSLLEARVRPHGPRKPDQPLARSRSFHVGLLDRIARLRGCSRLLFGGRVSALQFLERAIELLNLGILRRAFEERAQVLRFPGGGRCCICTVP